AGLDAQARVRAPREGLPLVWFGLATAPDEASRPLTTGEGFTLAPWEADWDRAQHAGRVEAVRAAFADGATYQFILRTRLRPRFTWHAFWLCGALAHRQQGSHHASVDLGRTAVVSASPESFLRWEEGELRTVPMKGTAALCADAAQDLAAREALRASEKERAEYIMIVALLRTDLSRVCSPGLVTVSDL